MAPKMNKPVKPYPDFPLTPHNCGRWCKSINGKIHYFSKWGRRKNGVMQVLPDNGAWREALIDYQESRDDIRLGREPRSRDVTLSVLSLVNRFLTAKKSAVANDELSERTFADYKRVCGLLIKHLGKNTDVTSLRGVDFSRLREELSKTRCVTTLAAEIVKMKVVFKFASDTRLIPSIVDFEGQFSPPKKHVLRKHRNEKKGQMYESEEICTILDSVKDPTMLAMAWISINTGMGPTDLGRIEFSDITGEWLEKARGKTGALRRCNLWDETRAAIEAYIEVRPTPQSGNEDLLFLTPTGLDFVKKTSQGTLAGRFAEELKTAGIYRPGVAFYGFRRAFATIASETRDQPAVDFLMGHSDDSMSSRYRQRIGDARLKEVTDYVHNWLFPAPSK